MKINKSIKITLIVLLTITTVLSGGWYISQPQIRAVASNADNASYVTVQEQSANQVNSQPTAQSIQTQTVNGITVTITSAKIISTGVQVNMCYSTPDAGDWYPLPGNLFYGAYVIPPDEFETISDQKANGINMGEKCVSIRHRIDDLESIALPITFSLSSIHAVPREIPPCDNFQNCLNTNAVAHARDLQAICSENSDGSIKVTLTGKRPDISQSEAQKTLDNILRGDVQGPWEFTINTIQGISLRQILNYDEGTRAFTPDETSITQDSPDALPVTEDFANIVPGNSDQKDRNEKIIEEAKGLIDKANTTILTAGWLHILSYTESFFSEAQSLPDGSPIPTKWRDELWVLLDEDGNAIQALTIQDTGNPVTSQISEFEEGIWTSITLGTSTQDREVYRPTLDSGFLTSAVAYKDIDVLDYDNIILNGINATVFTIAENAMKPVQIAKSDVQIIGTVNKYYFANDTGTLLKVERYQITLDGQLMLTQQITTVVIEKVSQPPTEVSNYFDPN